MKAAKPHGTPYLRMPLRSKSIRSAVIDLPGLSYPIHAGETNGLSEAIWQSRLAPRTTIRPFRIISPLTGTVAFLDPDLPGQGGKFPLEIAGSGSEKIEWISPSLTIEQDGEFSWLLLQPGEHKVIARDQKSGQEVQTRLTVQAL